MSSAAQLVGIVTMVGEFILLWLGMSAWNPDPPRTVIGWLGAAAGFIAAVVVMGLLPSLASIWIDHP